MSYGPQYPKTPSFWLKTSTYCLSGECILRWRWVWSIGGLMLTATNRSSWTEIIPGSTQSTTKANFLSRDAVKLNIVWTIRSTQTFSREPSSVRYRDKKQSLLILRITNEVAKYNFSFLLRLVSVTALHYATSVNGKVFWTLRCMVWYKRHAFPYDGPACNLGGRRWGKVSASSQLLQQIMLCIQN
jgi:hypothetical protein